MAYTDYEMKLTTQIAYMDFDKKVLKEHGGECDIRTLLSNDESYYQDLQDKLANATDDISRDQIQGQIDTYNMLTDKDSPYGDWKIVDIEDQNEETGFRACLIETDEKEAIIGFRGSESYDLQQVKNDWIDADLKLLNNKETLQQENAKSYVEEIWKNYGTRYDSFAMTGHSLGGNLAFSAALDAPDKMQEKITQVVSMDGPGYSNKFLESRADDIEKMAPKMEHIKWSWVGGLMNQVPGVKEVNVEVQKEPDNIAQKVKYGLFRHDTCFVQFDENGKAIRADKENSLSVKLGNMSRNLDENLYSLSDIKKKVVEQYEGAVEKLDKKIDSLVKTQKSIEKNIGKTFTYFQKELLKQKDKAVDGIKNTIKLKEFQR